MISYDTNNVFAKILRGEIPCKKIYEDDNVLCFEDIARAAPIHLLVIPKQNYNSYHDFVLNADPLYVANFFKTIAQITESLGIDKTGYRLVANIGSNVGQTIFHFHMHILAGKKMSELAP
jgi:diadenosine tetraphosphate (Ap4A) HIT family hydrolase